MSNSNKLTDIRSLGEFGLIRHLTKDFRNRQESTQLGIGDDAAVIQYEDGPTIISTDLLIEGIHFDLMYASLQHLGYKSIVVNLSDIYAMNALPKQVTVSLAVSSKFSVEALESLYDGIEKACRYYGVDLIGGDTTSSRIGLVISVTALGTVEPDKIVRRSTANVEDIVCVTGDLGAAYLGLQVLEREKKVFIDNPDMQPKLEMYQYLIERQLKPEARKDVIELFDKLDILPTAMIDLSDGLSSDLRHICEQSKVGAHIFEENLPIHPAAHKLAFEEFKISPTTCALNGGEDYELLVCLTPDDWKKVEGAGKMTAVGKIVEMEKGIKLFTPNQEGFDLVAQGWNAFGS